MKGMLNGVCAYVCVHVCVHVCVCVCVCVCVHEYLCVSTHSHGVYIHVFMHLTLTPLACMYGSVCASQFRV